MLIKNSPSKKSRFEKHQTMQFQQLRWITTRRWKCAKCAQRIKSTSSCSRAITCSVVPLAVSELKSAWSARNWSTTRSPFRKCAIYVKKRRQQFNLRPAYMCFYVNLAPRLQKAASNVDFQSCQRLQYSLAMRNLQIKVSSSWICQNYSNLLKKSTMPRLLKVSEHSA